MINRFSIYFIFGLINFSQPLKVVRDHTKDILYCPKDVECSLYNAQQTDDQTCDCKGGSFVKYKNEFQCLKNTSKVSGCEFYFKYFEESFPTISVQGALAFDFTEKIYSRSTTCNTVTLASIDYYHVGLNNWMQLSKIDFVILLSSSGGFTVKWRDPFSVNTDLYSGQLIKFNFECTTLRQKVQSKNSYCAIGKIVGQRNWTDSSTICKSTITPPTPKPSQTPSQTPSKTSKDDKEGKGISTPLIGAIVAAVLMLVLIIIAIVFCHKRNYSCCKKKGAEEGKPKPIKKKKKNPDIVNIQLTSTSDYAEPEELQFQRPLESPTNFENKSYLTSIKSNVPSSTNNNKNYENYPKDNGEIYSYETTSRPLLNSDNTYEPVIYEEPDKREQYTTLSTSQQPEYNTLSLNREAENDYYEAMTSGTMS